MPNQKLVLSFFVGLIVMGIPNASNSRTVMMGVMNKKCPEGYVLVPPDPNYGSQPNYFCVAKYEMKYSTGGIPVSKPEGQPWTGDTSFLNLDGQDHRVTRNKAISYCSSLGPRFSLISNDQWQTIARNIARTPLNWNASTIGTTLAVGSLITSPTYTELKSADPTNSDLCFETGSSPCSWASWNQLRRTHRLTNTEEVWDFGGNAREWVSTDRLTTHSNVENYFVSATYLTSHWFGLESGFTCSTSNTVPYCHLGKAIHNEDDFADKPAILRGAGFGSFIYDYGIFSANTNHNSTLDSNYNWGFRCIYKLEN